MCRAYSYNYLLDHPELTDSFIENYNRLLMPALKLMSALLNTIGRVNTVVLEKVKSILLFDFK